MKLPLFLLLNICYYGVFAQPCASHALMQKGAQLEYHVYSPKLNQAGGVAGHFKMSGKETITTPAGSFVCYKIYVDSDQKMNKFPAMSNRGTIYYNTELGVIKYEAPYGYAELVNVKK